MLPQCKGKVLDYRKFVSKITQGTLRERIPVEKQGSEEARALTGSGGHGGLDGGRSDGGGEPQGLAGGSEGGRGRPC